MVYIFVSKSLLIDKSLKPLLLFDEQKVKQKTQPLEISISYKFKILLFL